MSKKKSTTLLYLIRDDEILLAMKKRGFGANRYNGVGGKIEPSETLEQALIRECQEEIGVTPQQYHAIAEHNFYGPDEEPFHMHVHAFFCTEWDGEPAETEEMAPAWHKITDIPYNTMWSSDLHWLPGVLTGKKLHGEFHFDDSHNVLSHNLEEMHILPFEKAL